VVKPAERPAALVERPKRSKNEKLDAIENEESGELSGAHHSKQSGRFIVDFFHLPPAIRSIPL
jgi:hypothetical protein